MGLTYAILKLTNLFSRQVVEITALIDTGAAFMCPALNEKPLKSLNLR